MFLEKIDMLYKIAVNTFPVLTQLIMSIFLTVLCKDFAKNKNKIYLVGLVYFCTSLVLNSNYFNIPNIIAYSISLFVSFLIYLYLDKRNMKIKIFLMGTFFVIRWVSLSLGDVLEMFFEFILSNEAINSMLNDKQFTIAVEATDRGGEIKISSFKNRNAYFITVENSFNGILSIDEESGLPKTTKEDKNLHGFGMKNIKNIVEKYLADITIKQKTTKLL